ncbi:hypothetical protein [Thorsellia anophelis]|uniref:Uncharacterized protein n=1 Tax=Thorsellia anophelis DSM 18579 TaxID=1123402 RepID=A0A1I0DFU4_9GAMM|nr:hypothetical protein [Thorsellia anophelis]SET30648.1 hypothetical protein SAMN02583745_01958 [Thorsellia anophelis DSM 18579]
MPNEFWPDTPAPPYLSGGIGNEIQQKTAANNPDIFCKTQGSSYRLPSIGEFHAGAKNVFPGGDFERQSPAHWSQFIDNDITKNMLPVNSNRTVNGSLYNEWGDVTKYVNGWESGNYWSTEQSVAQDRAYGGRNRVGGYGRPVFISTGTTSYPPVETNGFEYRVFTNVTSLFNVACVRDLVPTPSTPSPSKS